MSSLSWRAMRPADLPAIAEIAEQAHPLFPEHPDVFAEKQRLFEPFCFTLEGDGDVAGYGISHPWMRGSIPPLNRMIGSPPKSPDCVFVHDVAIAPKARGSNASGLLIDIIAGAAKSRGLGDIALVSLYGADRVWSRHGFMPAEIEKEEIASYGPSAIYMVKTLR